MSDGKRFGVLSILIFLVGFFSLVSYPVYSGFYTNHSLSPTLLSSHSDTTTSWFSTSFGPSTILLGSSVTVSYSDLAVTPFAQHRKSILLSLSRLSFRHCCVICLLLCSNIESNPGPCIEQRGACSALEGSTAIKVFTVDKRWKFPCGTCSKPVKANQRSVQCDVCQLWLHARCVGIPVKSTWSFIHQTNHGVVVNAYMKLFLFLTLLTPTLFFVLRP